MKQNGKIEIKQIESYIETRGKRHHVVDSLSFWYSNSIRMQDLILTF